MSYSKEAFSALAFGERRMQAWAEVADGTPWDARVRFAAKALRLIEVTEAIGCRAGILRARATAGRRKARDLAVDALVAATAERLPRPVVVLTSDAGDLDLLLAESDAKVMRI